MILSAHQPIFLPYLGFFNKLKQSDLFMLMDLYPVNFKDKNKFDNRNRIRINNKKGWQWITVPVLHTKKQQRFNEVRIDESQPWRERMYRIIKANYENTPYFKPYFKLLQRYLDIEYDTLADLNITLIKKIVEWLDLTKLKSYKYNKPLPLPLEVQSKPVHISRRYASPLYLDGTSSEKIVQLCYAAKLDKFLFGADGRKYADLTLFAQEGIEVLFQDYKHPVYAQHWEPFVSHLSVIDALFNLGKEGTKKLI